MRSGILFLFVLGLFICIVEVRGACECLPREVKTNGGKIIGNCKSEDNTSSAGKYKGRKWCYAKKKDCECQNTTQRFAKLCVMYDLCDGGGGDDDYEEYDYDYEEDNEEDNEEDEEDYDEDYDYEEYDYDDYEDEEDGKTEVVGARVTGKGARSPAKKGARSPGKLGGRKPGKRKGARKPGKRKGTGARAGGQ